jgi:hypothetical protein
MGQILTSSAVRRLYLYCFLCLKWSFCGAIIHLGNEGWNAFFCLLALSPSVAVVIEKLERSQNSFYDL